jgi:hypothetical protein
MLKLVCRVCSQQRLSRCPRTAPSSAASARATARQRLKSMRSCRTATPGCTTAPATGALPRLHCRPSAVGGWAGTRCKVLQCVGWHSPCLLQAMHMDSLQFVPAPEPHSVGCSHVVGAHGGSERTSQEQARATHESISCGVQQPGRGCCCAISRGRRGCSCATSRGGTSRRRKCRQKAARAGGESVPGGVGRPPLGVRRRRRCSSRRSRSAARQRGQQAAHQPRGQVHSSAAAVLSTLSSLCNNSHRLCTRCQ